VSQHDDSNQLSPQVAQATSLLEYKSRDVSADARYSSVGDVQKVDPEINVIVPSLNSRRQRPPQQLAKKNVSRDHSSFC